MYYAFVIRLKNTSKIINIISMFIIFILSFIICYFMVHRTYRYYKIEGHKITNYSFLSRAFKDYKNEKVETIYSTDVVFKSRRKILLKKGRTQSSPPKEKIYYIDIDDGKYVIPIKEKQKKDFMLDPTQQYPIYVYKNTKLEKDISIVLK